MGRFAVDRVCRVWPLSLYIPAVLTIFTIHLCVLITGLLLLTMKLYSSTSRCITLLLFLWLKICNFAKTDIFYRCVIVMNVLGYSDVKYYFYNSFYVVWCINIQFISWTLSTLSILNNTETLWLLLCWNINKFLTTISVQNTYLCNIITT